MRNKLQFEPESEEAHDLQMLYTIMVSTTNMLSACALCLCECVAVSWGCVAVETVKTALQESDAKLSMEGLQEVTRQLGEKAWGVFVESAWDKFADQLKQVGNKERKHVYGNGDNNPCLHDIYRSLPLCPSPQPPLPPLPLS
ncbi:hypothetical protein EON65_18540 [archaeon]|nr:MAG: hypothetical protein EON65_18540 [archaeon]